MLPDKGVRVGGLTTAQGERVAHQRVEIGVDRAVAPVLIAVLRRAEVVALHRFEKAIVAGQTREA